MIALLIWLLGLLILIYVAHLIIAAVKLPENIKTVAYLIVAIVALVALLHKLEAWV